MNSDAVLDRETGLVWERSPSDFTTDWFSSSSLCPELNTGGRRGWRLPTLQELLSLVNDSASLPSLPAGHPFTLLASPPIFWAATTWASDSTRAYAISFSFGKVIVGNKSTDRLAAWCVRGGQGVDPQ